MTTQLSESVPAGAERRRSQRVLLVVPVEVAWRVREDVQVKERAETEEVNAHGALLRMKTQLPLAMEFDLTHLKTLQSTRAKVVGLRQSTGGIHKTAVELAVPSETFWGVTIPRTLSAPSS